MKAGLLVEYFCRGQGLGVRSLLYGEGSQTKEFGSSLNHCLSRASTRPLRSHPHLYVGLELCVAQDGLVHLRQPRARSLENRDVESSSLEVSRGLKSSLGMLDGGR